MIFIVFIITISRIPRQNLLKSGSRFYIVVKKMDMVGMSVVTDSKLLSNLPSAPFMSCRVRHALPDKEKERST